MADDRYLLISADCHAGGSHEQYREYLDPAYRDEFDAWRQRYSNPFRDLQADGRTPVPADSASPAFTRRWVRAPAAPRTRRAAWS
jgi:hypothetical protein